MIFEPTNIIPSTLTGTGTIQSSDNEGQAGEYGHVYLYSLQYDMGKLGAVGQE